MLLKDIGKLISGTYAKPDITKEIFYLQTGHFTDAGRLDETVKPMLQYSSRLEKHLLQEGDVLFTAKGTSNISYVYYPSYGQAVASSSFIVIRINENNKEKIKPEYLSWFLSFTPQIRLFHQRQIGTTIPSISIKELKEIEVDIPTMEKQEAIIKVHSLRHKEKVLKDQLEQMREIQIQQLLFTALKN
jgi:restriction endonuclease S subunit